MGIIWQAVGAADVQSVLEDGSSLLYGRLAVSLKRDETKGWKLEGQYW